MKPSECLPAIQAPYELTPQSAELLAAAAGEACNRCKGTGISNWKRKGVYPVVCNCAKEKWLAEAESTKTAIQRAIAAAQAGTLEGPLVGGVPPMPPETPAP